MDPPERKAERVKVDSGYEPLRLGWLGEVEAEEPLRNKTWWLVEVRSTEP